MVHLGMAWHGVAWRGGFWQAWSISARHGKARRGEAGYAWPIPARCCWAGLGSVRPAMDGRRLDKQRRRPLYS